MELFYILTFKRNSPENKPMCWIESEFHNCIFYQHQIGQVKLWFIRTYRQDSITVVSHFNTAFKESSLEYANQRALIER